MGREPLHEGQCEGPLHAHHGEKPFRCPECDKGFLQESEESPRGEVIHSPVMSVEGSLRTWGRCTPTSQYMPRKALHCLGQAAQKVRSDSFWVEPAPLRALAGGIKNEQNAGLQHAGPMHGRQGTMAPWQRSEQSGHKEEALSSLILTGKACQSWKEHFTLFCDFISFSKSVIIPPLFKFPLRLSGFLKR